MRPMYMEDLGKNRIGLRGQVISERGDGELVVHHWFPSEDAASEVFGNLMWSAYAERMRLPFNHAQAWASLVNRKT